MRPDGEPRAARRTPEGKEKEKINNRVPSTNAARFFAPFFFRAEGGVRGARRERANPNPRESHFDLIYKPFERI